MKSKKATQDIVFVGLMAAMLTISQVIASALPNIELVSFLIIMFTLHLQRLSKYAIAVFVVLQGLIYGFHIWWICYLYIWYTLFFAIVIFKKHASAFNFAFLSAVFGLLFGTLCAIPQFIVLGIGGGMAYIIAGIPFDIVHCIGNFIIMHILYTPVERLLLSFAKNNHTN